jgi:hypothetical protein
LKASETKTPTKSYCFHAIHSKYKTQECLEEALEGGKHVIPIPIEVLQKKNPPWDSPKHFWLGFFLVGFVGFIFLNLQEMCYFCLS